MLRRGNGECPKCGGKGYIQAHEGARIVSRPCNCKAGVAWASQFTEENLLTWLGVPDKVILKRDA